LFKIEFDGDGMLALCSKSYFVWGDDKCKYSCKGAQKSRIGLIREQYINCLNQKQFVMCTNVGFRKDSGKIKTYEQQKIGLTPIYTKGILHKNGINVFLLNILFILFNTTL